MMRVPKGHVHKPTDGETYHKGKDGKYYTYQDLSVANRRYLDKTFELDKIRAMNAANIHRRMSNITNGYKNTKKKSKNNKPSNNNNKQSNNSNNQTKKREAAPEPFRKSARLRAEEPVDHSAHGSNTADTAAEQTADVKPKLAKPKRIVEMTEEDRARLQNLPEWISKLQDYLLTVDKISIANCRRAMGQIEKLATGVGITYHKWEEGTWFYRGTKVDMSFDFDKILEEAAAMESQHGKDLSNGWLMRHPLIKVKNFQQYLKDKEEQEQKETEAEAAGRTD